MDITARIIELNKERGWTIYKLAKEAKMAPSTLTNMLRRGTSPSLATMERLWRAYDMTPAQFFYDGSEMMGLTESQQAHLEKWSRLSERQKKAVDYFIDGLVALEKNQDIS